ncbi:hypothetical protein ABZ348_30975 [Streptomyces sp. NPDC005963]|uniref:hypothetical protein n=1 Tax=Streptomyces sp. NPDC005963 TaxID=3156721 RepID=UPI0033D12AEE
MSADLYDALNQNTRATGQWGKGKAPKFKPWPRPKNKSKVAEAAEKDSKRRVSVAEIYKKFTARR